MRAFGKADVAFLPGLGFGVTIQPGPITREMIAGLFPHQTTVVHEQMTGTQILEVLEQSATNLRPPDDMDRVGGMVQTAGMRWTIDLTRPVGHRTRDVTIGNTPLDPARSYAVMTNGGMLQGTHRYTSFARGTAIERDEVPFSRMLEDALHVMGIIHAPQLGDVALIR